MPLNNRVATLGPSRWTTTVSSEVTTTSISRYPRDRTSSGDCLSAQTTVACPGIAFEINYLTISALVTFIANECSDDTFTPGARSEDAERWISHCTVSAVMPRRSIHARIVTSGNVIARQGRATDASDSRCHAHLSVKPPSYYHHGELRGHNHIDIVVPS